MEQMARQQRQQQHQRGVKLIHAGRRIGRTPEEALQWWLRFSEKDLNTLNESDWTHLIYEVAWLCVFGPPIPGTVPGTDELQDASIVTDKALPTHAMVKRFQKWTRARLQEFIEEASTDVVLAPSSRLRVTHDRQALKVNMRLKTVNLEQGFRFSFLQNVRVAGARLKQCLQCGTNFSGRANQDYCSHRCQNDVAVMKFREKEKVATRKNPNAKSSRRKGSAGKGTRSLS